MKKKQFAALGMAVILGISSLSGCGIKTDTPIIGTLVGLDSDQIFQVENLICSREEYMLILMNTQNEYKNDFGGTVDWNAKIDENTTLHDYVMERVKEDITLNYTLAAFATDKGIQLTEEEKTNISAAAGEYFDTLNEAEKDYTEASVTDVESVYTNYLLANKLYSQLTADVGTRVSDEEARVIKIQYIRMSTEKNKESEIKSTYENVIDLVNGGYQQFSREAKQYSEDEVIEKTLKKNEASLKFEQEAFNLSDGEMSEIIQEDNDFYLVYCVNSYMQKETAENKQNIITQLKEDAFQTQYDQFVDNAKTDFNTKAWNKMELSGDENVKNADLMNKYNAMTTE